MVSEYWPFLFALVLFVAGLILHGIRANQLVKRKTKELSRANTNIEHLQKVGIIGQISGMVAHELRQPLGTIECYVEGIGCLLEQSHPDRQVLKESLEEIRKQEKRAAKIVDRVRAYAKTRKADCVRVNLEETVSRVVSNFRASGKSFAQICLEVEPGLPPVVADSLEMEIVALNLIKNAAEALEQAHIAKPMIRVKLTREENEGLVRVRLSVTDNGAVVSEDKFANISSFSSQSDKANGLGLGIGIVRSIISMLGGRIEFERNRDGGGITASVVLPAAKGVDK